MGDFTKNVRGEPVHVYLMPDGSNPYHPDSTETEFFRKKYRPPFEPVFVNGLRMGEPKTDLERLGLCFALPLFLGKGTVNEFETKDASTDWPAEFRNHPAVQRQLNPRGQLRRRFSGNVHWPLPRSKYFSIVGRNPKSRSYGIIGELNAYAIPILSGCCIAVSDDETDNIKLVFKGLPNEPNPLFQFVNYPRQFEKVFDSIPNGIRSLLTADVVKLVPDSNEWSLELPTVTTEIASDRVFDMRMPATRDWMMNFFRNPPQAKTDADLAHGDFLRAYAEDYKIDLSKIGGWNTMIPIVCYQAVGGNALTDAFAAFLRRLGCTGIVYPSARCDHGVYIENNCVVDDWGWHFVDFAGSETPTRIAPEFVRPMPPMQGPYFYAEINTGTNAGSFTTIGGSLHTRMSLQFQFDQFALSRRRLLKGDGQSISSPMTSFTWYGRDYINLSNDVFCGKCSSRFNFHDVGPRETCPSCKCRADISGYKECPRTLLMNLHPVAPEN